MAKNLYDVLGLTAAASDKEIRSAYRKLARKFHPDVSPNDKAAESRFKEVTAAYEVLSDEANRKKYDKYGDRWEYADQIEEQRRQQAAGGRARQGGSTVFNSETAAGGDFGSIFENLFRGSRGGPRGHQANRRGQDVETPVEVTLEEAFRGTSRTIQLDGQNICPTCGGSGEVAGATCHTCEGMGQVSRQRRLEVKVPPGVKTGSRVRVAGEGRPGTGSGPSGDLYLVTTVRAHARFERKGDDLYVEATVPYTDAVLGGEVEVQTMDGRVVLRVPELTQTGRQIRLGGKGMPVLAKAEKGDLYVRIRVMLPEHLSADERAHFEQLRALREPARVQS